MRRRSLLWRVYGWGTALLAAVAALAWVLAWASRGAPPATVVWAALAAALAVLALGFILARVLTAPLTRVAAAAAAEQARLRATLGGIVEGVLAVDLEERVIHCNAPAAEMLRISNASPVQHHLWAVTPVAEVCDLLRRCIRSGVDADGEVRVADGARSRVIEVRTAALRDLHGAPTGAVAVLNEVTQLHHVEAMRRDFVANASHELKTPITAVRAQVETILDDPAMPPEVQREFLEKALVQTLRLSAIVGDLLTLSRLESAERTPERVPLDLRAAVRATVADLRGPAESRGVTLTTELPPAPVTVLGDLPALEQALRNLVDNGIKYTPAGGTVSVRLRRERGRALIEVADTGPGISPEDRERVFERFYRVDKARSREMGGTGLGLSIVKHVVLAHGGTVTAGAAPAAGAVFRVRLPLAPNPE